MLSGVLALLMTWRKILMDVRCNWYHQCPNWHSDKLTFASLSIRSYWLQTWFLCALLTARLQRSKDRIWTGLHAPRIRRHVEAVQILRLVHEDQADCTEVPTAHCQGLHVRETGIASYSPGDNLEFTKKWRMYTLYVYVAWGAPTNEHSYM